MNAKVRLAEPGPGLLRFLESLSIPELLKFAVEMGCIPDDALFLEAVKAVLKDKAMEISK